MPGADTQREPTPRPTENPRSTQVQGRFVWPPRPAVNPGNDHLETTQPSVAALPLSAWEQFEEEWLGVTTPPLRRRLADAGAAPDPLNAFCWRCARTVGPYETDAKGCSHCRGTRPPWNRFVRLAEYADPWRRIVQDAKFTRWPRLSVDLGKMLGRQVVSAVPDLGDWPTVVVPVPTNYFRRLARSTDHSLNLARGVAQELGLPLRCLLSRSSRPEQARLSATDRLTNLRDAMRRGPLDPVWGNLRLTRAARWPNGAASARIVLVDDISTTGGTMTEACRAARQVAKALGIQDLEIIAATICRTEERR
jgi:predicted amidophosphoribosyltransferase